MLRVGVVGVGMMGQHHVRVYSELAREGKVELVGIADANFERAKELAKKYGTVPYGDYRELAKENLDAVDVAVPTSLHKDVALEFISHGTSVLVEKPIADTIENARAIIQAAEEAGVTLMVGHIERFNPAVLRLKDLISEGELGKLVTISAKRVGPMATRIRDVGIIVDLGVHDIDVISYLFGEPIKTVYARAGNVVHPAGVEDHALITLGFEDGTGIVETNWLTPHKTRTLTVVGTGGIAYLNYIEQSLKLYNSDWIKEAKIQKREPLRNELEHFIECVKAGKKPIVDGRAGLHALRVALLAQKSARTGKVMEVRE
ncbi:UDP-N-acetylglucosamine 3-dehydrogenase [Thermococcus gammatolerans]|uniref:Oxidoreductase n=1 Tax=Thermococcus gammatolerans (strain DSM 15229 / JCM 11827 / EJ3) TaxID=593117 RepID=C5A2Z2_THEGJ|nr:UDP-N-acetylglucosamine 3-dehydrogenase [Thermococcus gammatolerans]ACS34653.1 Oxidoreductase, substrate unknown [Thermococcus gammatolerans EJ3]